MPDIATVEPLEITAGDTISWSRSLDDYPAGDGWILKYALVNADGKIAITSSADGDDHLVAVTAATSAGWTAGDYSWTAYVESGVQRYTIDHGTITIKPDLDAANSYDGRSHVQKTYEALKSVVEGKASKDQISYSINGRSISRMSWEEIMKAYRHFESRWQAEQNDERIRRGLPGTGGNKVYLRF